MGRIYIAPIDIPAANLADADADQDLFVIGAGSNNKLVIHEFEIYSDATTAASLKLELVRRSTAGTGGSAVTEEPLDPDMTITPTATVTTDVETPGTGTDVLANYFWEQLGPLIHRPAPEDRVIVDVSTFLALQLLTSPGGISVGGYIIWEEL